MLMSTHTGVGKHTLACGLLRAFARRGLSVSPFKSVSIERHTCHLPDGAEISFAIALQSVAAGHTAAPQMNPYVAHYGETFTLIELGKRLAKHERPNPVRDRDRFLRVIGDAFTHVASGVDAVVVEGAGSPVELGLEEVDLANVPVARLSRAAVVLVTEMTHGGGYASILGTWLLLPEDVRRQVSAVILNKFTVREPIEAARAGAERLAQLVGVPVMALPLLDDPFIPSDMTLYDTELARFSDYTVELDRLADTLERHVDVDLLFRLAAGGEGER